MLAGGIKDWVSPADGLQAQEISAILPYRNAGLRYLLGTRTIGGENNFAQLSGLNISPRPSSPFITTSRGFSRRK